MKQGWHRKEFTTKGVDPTTVVEWRFYMAGKLICLVTEFQNVYSCDDFCGPTAESDAKILHELLERDYRQKFEDKWNNLDYQENNFNDREIRGGE